MRMSLVLLPLHCCMSVWVQRWSRCKEHHNQSWYQLSRPAFTLDVDGDSNATGTVRQVSGISVLTTASGDATALAIALG